MHSLPSTALSWRRAAFLLVLLAFSLRALVPAGFMPDMTGTAGTPMVICHGADTRVVMLGPDGQPVDEAAPADGWCGFSVNGGGLVAAAPVLPVPAYAPAPASGRAFFLLPPVYTHAHAARAPPVARTVL